MRVISPRSLHLGANRFNARPFTMPRSTSVTSSSCLVPLRTIRLWPLQSTGTKLPLIQDFFPDNVRRILLTTTLLLTNPNLRSPSADFTSRKKTPIKNPTSWTTAYEPRHAGRFFERRDLGSSALSVSCIYGLRGSPEAYLTITADAQSPQCFVKSSSHYVARRLLRRFG